MDPLDPHGAANRHRGPAGVYQITTGSSSAGSKFRAAIDTLETIRDQRGVEHFDPNCGGPLTSLIDIIVFGAAVSPV